jgi:hypothetical protein
MGLALDVPNLCDRVLTFGEYRAGQSTALCNAAVT